MASVSFHLAEATSDFDVARELCRDWLDWHWRNYPDDWPRGSDHPMNPAKFQETIADLPKLHERPRGGIIIAYVDEQPAGCVMYHEAKPEVAEFKRLFVRENGRGHGVGRGMLEFMFAQMISDGYERVFFSSATFLTHAKRMYENAGFLDIQHPDGFPDNWRERVYFMERALG